MDLIIKSTAQGAATTVWAAVAKVWEKEGGKYLEDCQVSPPMPEAPAPGDIGHAKWAYNEGGEEKLWVDSEVMVGLKV